MQRTTKRRVILDVDVGVDDYLAILLFLHAEKSHDIKIEGIVCSMGNTSVDNVCRNVLRLLDATKRTDIPVFRGASQQFIPFTHSIHHYHGADGFGDVYQQMDEPDLTGMIQPQVGAVAMHDIIVNNPDEITLICVAPLTNVALALKLYDDFASKLKDIWIMGGNYTAVGNITAAAEYNFYIDPEAAYIVLDCITKPIYILTWESCLHPQISWDWRLSTFAKTTNPAVVLLNKAEERVRGDDEVMWTPCDAFLAAVFLYPSMITKQSTHHASVELNGLQTRGQIVLDHLKSKKPNVTIIEQINWERFKTLLLEII